MTGISVRALTTVITDRLTAELPNVPGYVTEAVDVPLIANSDGRTVPYWVLHPYAPSTDAEPDLADTVVDGEWMFQVTAAAGLTDDLTALVDRIHAALYRWVPASAGLVIGQLKPPPGYQAPALLDRDVTPHRPYMPLQYQALVTTT